MINRRVKLIYYSVLTHPMRLNGWLHRNFRAPRSGIVKAHLGPGQRNYLNGWVNVDANPISAKIDVWADLKHKLPFPDRSVDAFYSHHVIEHLPDCLLPFHFAEMHRCLKPGGIIRVGGPNGDEAARKLVEGDLNWFGDFPDRRESLGGRYANFILCRGEHLAILTRSYLEELASGAGFHRIQIRKPKTDTGYPLLMDERVLQTEDESTWDAPHTLLIEAER